MDEVLENECQLNLCTLRAQEKVGMLKHPGCGMVLNDSAETAGKDCETILVETK